MCVTASDEPSREVEDTRTNLSFRMTPIFLSPCSAHPQNHANDTILALIEVVISHRPFRITCGVGAKANAHFVRPFFLPSYCFLHTMVVSLTKRAFTLFLHPMRYSSTSTRGLRAIFLCVSPQPDS